MGKIMKSFRTKKWLKGLMLAMLLIVGSTVFSASAKEVQAATAGFKTIDGKTYYIKSDGSKQKGWMTLGGYKYYFNTKTGVQVKGWMKVNGKYTYYFTKGKGVMATGWMTDSAGNPLEWGNTLRSEEHRLNSSHPSSSRMPSSA